MQRIIFGILGLASLEASAFRTAIFDPVIQDRAVFWQNQRRLQNRPGILWVQAGDSLASGWGTRSTLRERLADAELRPLPDAGSLDDLQNHIPSTRYTWYAGTEINLGFLGVLDRLYPPTASLLSTALAGATLTVKNREDPLGLLLQIDETQRVEIVTLSLGGNDICQGLDPFVDGTLRDRLRLARSHMPSRARWLVWDVADVVAIYQGVMSRIDQLPDSPGKTRLRNYCDASWSRVNCPMARANPNKTREMRDRIRAAYEESFGAVVEFPELLRDRDLLDVLAGDCFHPSRLSQPVITKTLEAALERATLRRP